MFGIRIIYPIKDTHPQTRFDLLYSGVSTVVYKENIMTNQTRFYEPLTSQNAALVLVDHQVGLMTGVRDYSIGELKHNVVALAKAAKSLKLPIIVTTTARDSMWGPMFPNSLKHCQVLSDDARVARAIEAGVSWGLSMSQILRWQLSSHFL